MHTESLERYSHSPTAYAGTETVCSSLSSARIRDNAHTQVQSNHQTSVFLYCFPQNGGDDLTSGILRGQLAPKIFTRAKTYARET
ncbi:hypothetical protein XENTR_v10006534 [Xenopus tropicalis]|nr:hypothetical protein XENTR_v10006534 [Xenopus tropicalis]